MKVFLAFFRQNRRLLRPVLLFFGDLWNYAFQKWETRRFQEKHALVFVVLQVYGKFLRCALHGKRESAADLRSRPS